MFHRVSIGPFTTKVADFKAFLIWRMELEQVLPRFELTNLFKSLPRCVYSSVEFEDTSTNTTTTTTDDEHSNFTTEEFNMTDTEKNIIESVCRDDRTQLLTQTKKLAKSASKDKNSEGDKNRDAELVDQSVVSKLLQLCCVFDSVECATAIINGDLGTVPLINEMDDRGLSVLHTAAEMHATRCIRLLLHKRARTDVKTKDGRGLIALQLSLLSKRMDVPWTPDDSIEDLLVLLSELDLTAIRLLLEKTKEIAEVAYLSAMEGRVVSLAALLMVAAEKVNVTVLVLKPDNVFGIKETTTIYECVIRETLSLGQDETLSSGAAKWSRSDTSEKRKFLLCQIELLQLFGAVSKSCYGDRKIISPLIPAIQAGDEALVKLLLKTSINVNETDTEGNSALHLSLKSSSGSSPQQLRILCLLLKHGAGVSRKNRLGLTALHVAAANGNLQALQILLLEDPSSVNSVTEMKETPLFFAAKNDFWDCADLLLRSGANTEILNLRRQRPVDLAKSQDMRLLLSQSNISITNRASPIQKKNVPCHNDFTISRDSFLPISNEGAATERAYSSAKMEICRYFESPGGCVRGAKCFYAHGEEELRQAKLGLHLTRYSDVEELTRKIFVGGLPCSLDSDGLSKFFEEQFGSVEDAIVIEAQAGYQIQSRGFGFVTFKEKKSVSAAVSAHYVAIMGKQVEIKSAVPKSLIAEFQKLPPRQQELQNIQSKPQEGRTEQISWVNVVLRNQKKMSSNESQAYSGDQITPAWVSTFKKWLPLFLNEVSNRLKEGEWYPLSSLKGDFRATCGLELDHTSLGYPKLSDFMRSFSSICHMKVVPIGGRGPATHMVLLPNYPRQCQPVFDDMPKDDSDDFKVLSNIFASSDDDFALVAAGSGKGSLSSATQHEQPAQDSNNTYNVPLRFLGFLKADTVFRHDHRPDEDDEDPSWNRWGGRLHKNDDRIQTRLLKHPILIALALKRNMTSVYFLRDSDFCTSYRVNLSTKKCFACNLGKMLWANMPCKDLLWCSSCQQEFRRVVEVNDPDHKCVICDKPVMKIEIMRQKQQQTVPTKEDFLPLF